MFDSSRLKEALLDEGAAMVGVTPALYLPDVERFIDNCASGGLFAGMDWLEKSSHLRAHPPSHIKDARAVICTAWPYAGHDGKHIARFAQHIDYHGFIAGRLKSAWDKAVAGLGEAVFFVDSGPLAEKAYAAQAGIGWIGKNTLLINPDIGSYFCLGLIVTDVDVAGEVATHYRFSKCGDCTRCIDACPTGALVEPGVLDCRRCISYLTIEHKGEIPAELRPLVGTRIFGCDICQEACPYNRDVGTAGVIPRINLDIDSPGDLLDISVEEFRRRFEGTPVFRLGRERFSRNVLLAVENI